MTDVFLGVIAVSTLAMAIGQVAVVVVAARTIRRVGDRVGQLEETIRPIVANVQSISDDAARAASLAAQQVERADRLMDDMTQRVEETMTMLQKTILGPARTGRFVVQTMRDVLAAFFDRAPRHTRSPAHGPSPAAAEEDASFIG